ncbi:MAG: hypothetical protein RJB62_829 [Pseudomonadota bacterium]|jgi:hypothetical protein
MIITGCGADADFSVEYMSPRFSTISEFYALPLFEKEGFDFIVVAGDEEEVFYTVLHSGMDYRPAFELGVGGDLNQPSFVDVDNDGDYEINVRTVDDFRCAFALRHDVIVGRSTPFGDRPQVINPEEICQ